MNFYKILFLFIFVFSILIFYIFAKNIKYKKNFYYDQKGELVCEKIEAEFMLNFLYNNFLGKFLRFFLNKKIISQVVGWYQNSWLSKFMIKSFIKKYNIDTTQFLLPVSEFKSFNDFFIRELKPGARPILVDKRGCVSPADSKLFVIPNISLSTDFFVKGKKFNIISFLKNKELAKKYENGLMLVFRLTPSDYHRYHFPFSCFASDYKTINGIFESVNPIVYRAGIQPLYENERQLIILESSLFGEVLFVVVGAMFVGKIVQTYEINSNNNIGEQFGYFEYGGSTLVMLFEKDKIKIKQKFIDNSAHGYETEVRVGQEINK